MSQSKPSAELVQIVSKLADKLPLAFIQQLDEWAGDKIKYQRFKHLLATMEKASRLADGRGFDMTQAKTLAMHVGLPWVDKASLCENDYLQDRWAQLLISLTAAPRSNYRTGATYVRILAELDPWDCKVLEYVVENGGLSKSLFKEIDREELLHAIPGPEHHQGRTLLSIEKLVGCGCLVTTDAFSHRADGGISIYGGIVRRMTLTAMGLNFHIAVSGKAPAWLEIEDEYRDDIHPIARI